MVESKRIVARAVVDDRLACREAWMAAGFAVEFALKALIIRRERLNSWPSKEHRPELYTHSVRDLFQAAKVELKAAPRELRGALRTVLDWNRAHEYTSGRMSRANARSMVSAAFDPEGVVAWLNGL
jgi:HEPN domain-containing protein